MKTKILIAVLTLCTTMSYGQLKVLSNGNVGIGNSNPSTKLVVQYSGTTYNVTYANANSSSALWTLNNYNATGSGFGFGVDNTGKGRIFKGTIASPSIFMTFLYSSGNVGIGDDAPAEMFTVGSGGLFRVKSTGIVQSVSGSTSAPTYSFTNSTKTGMFSSGTGVLNFSTETGGTGYERMRIESDGDVCVGATSSPNYGKMYIYQTSSPAGLRVYKYNSAAYSYNIVSNVTNDTAKSYLSLKSGSEKFVIWGNGAVGIGCSNFPASPLYLQVNGDAYSYGSWLGSDANFKQDITDISSPTDIIMQLSGKKYKYNSAAFPERNFRTGYSYGVIAQEVQSVLPELVIADSAGFLAVNYDEFIPILIEGMKEQQNVIEQQTAQLNDLEARLNITELRLNNCCTTISDGLKSEQIQNNSGSDLNNNLNPALFQNIPNPFNKKTTIRYFIPENTGSSSILVFDMQGKLVKTYPVSVKGNGNIEINANELQPGMYMYSLITGGKEIDTKKMILTD